MQELHIKSPLGIMPEWIWKERRIRELTEAIQRQFSIQGYTPNMTLIAEWSDEICRHSRELRRIKNAA